MGNTEYTILFPSFSLSLSKLLKKQEQTLKDLRVTLQRELKVQALPNDEVQEPPSAAGQPNSGATTIGGRFDSSAVAGRSSSPAFYNSSSSSLSQQQHQNHSNYHHYNHPHTNMNQSNFMHGHSGSSSAPSFSPAVTSTNPSAAVLSVQSSLPYAGSASSSAVVSLTAHSPSVPSGAQDSLTTHTASVKRELDKDVNFMYLKHVVLKFMLSREAEVSVYQAIPFVSPLFSSSSFSFMAD